MAADDRCPRCDRAECQRERLSSQKNASYLYDHDRERALRIVKASAAADDDCEAHAVDWRARALAAEATIARVEALLPKLLEAGDAWAHNILRATLKGDNR